MQISLSLEYDISLSFFSMKILAFKICIHIIIRNCIHVNFPDFMRWNSGYMQAHLEGKVSLLSDDKASLELKQVSFIDFFPVQV